MSDIEVLPAVIDLSAIKSYRGKNHISSILQLIDLLITLLGWVGSGGAASLLDLDVKILMACKLPVLDIRHFSLQNKLQSGMGIQYI